MISLPQALEDEAAEISIPVKSIAKETRCTFAAKRTLPKLSIRSSDKPRHYPPALPRSASG